MISAVNNAKLCGTGRGVPAPEVPANVNAAIAITAKIVVFNKLVRFCVKLPQRIPRHCKAANDSTTANATGLSRPASRGTNTAAYSPTTIEITASVPQVDSQSLQ